VKGEESHTVGGRKAQGKTISPDRISIFKREGELAWRVGSRARSGEKKIAEGGRPPQVVGERNHLQKGVRACLRRKKSISVYLSKRRPGFERASKLSAEVTL